MTRQDQISSKPDVCLGKLCMTGTRIMVTVILDDLAEGLTETESLSSYPTRTSENIRTDIHYVSNFASGRVVTPPEAL
jgi:uncharacterized protein (DUF433 family)